MKKILMLLAILMAYGVSADTKVNWKASRGFYFNTDDTVGILGEATGNSTTAQLIYSVDDSVEAISVDGFTTDSILDSFTITEDGANNVDGFAYFSVINYDDVIFNDGYVYTVIYQDDNLDFGDWYFYTTPIALSNISGTDLPQSIEMNSDIANGNAIDVWSGSDLNNVAQVVPEPATFLLFGIGGIGAWLIRRNKLKSKEEA